MLLTRQFRLPAYLNGHPDGMLLEAPAGLLDDDDAGAEAAIRREAEEETGYRVDSRDAHRRVLHEPGLGDRAHRVLHGQLPRGRARLARAAAWRARARTSRSSRSTLAEAIAMVERGEIVDGKTVLLLRLAQLA